MSEELADVYILLVVGPEGQLKVRVLDGLKANVPPEADGSVREDLFLEHCITSTRKAELGGRARIYKKIWDSSPEQIQEKSS